MNQSDKDTSIDDTIAAIATPIGQGGIGIVRLSGPRALSVADKIFVSPKGRKPSGFKNFTAHYGWVGCGGSKDQGIRISGDQEIGRSREQGDGAAGKETIDEVLLTVMRGPRSYTKEDMVEISCHGGIVPLRAILNRALEAGARLAEPGEFTKKAFLNGRIDLAQAEAVLDIIQSRTEAFLRVSTHQLKGELSRELEMIREQLMPIYVELEAVVNFPEDDIDSDGRGRISEQIRLAQERVEKLLASSEQGRILREGIKIVICGKPNVGKSSLLNILLKTPRAIVSEIAGTTRDTIEESAQIQGIPFQLVDTAGILEPRDLIEEEAVKRSRMSIQAADLVLLMLDAGGDVTAEDEDLMRTIAGQNFLVILNKCDLAPRLRESRLRECLPGKPFLKISALKKTGIADLEAAIVAQVWHGPAPDEHGILVSNIRHVEALKKSREALHRAQETLSGGHSLEFVSEDIKLAVSRLDTITGRHIDADLLDQIFSRFCIGK